MTEKRRTLPNGSLFVPKAPYKGGLREAVSDIENDAYVMRKANPLADLALSVFPPYSMVTAVQDATRAQTPQAAGVDLLGALPIVKGARGLRTLANSQGVRQSRTGTAQVYSAGALGAGAVGVDRVNDFEEADQFRTGQRYAK